MMKLYTFPRKNSIQQDMDNYANAFSKVMNYCNQVEGILIPIPANAPSWYADSVDKISLAKINAGFWKSSVSQNLIMLPQMILNYKPIYMDRTSYITNHLKMLADHPEDGNLQQDILLNITQLQDVLNGQTGCIQENIQNLNTYNTKFATDIDNFQTICNLALQDEKVNNEKIKEVKKKIEDLETLIEHFNTWITVGEVATGTGVALILYGLAAGGWTLVAGIVLTVAGSAELIALEIAKSVELDKLKEEKKDLIDLENTTVSLVSLENKINGVLSSSNHLQDNMKSMTNVWTTMDEFTKEITRMLENEKKSLDRDTLLCVANNMDQSNISAADFYEMADHLSKLNFTYVNKEIDVVS